MCYIYIHPAYQRIEPNIRLSNSVGIVSATVTMSSYTALDAMNLQESLTSTHSVVGKYANGVLTLTARDESVTDPAYWSYILSQVAYRFPDSYKPCSSFLDGYNPDWFTFQVGGDHTHTHTHLFHLATVTGTGTDTNPPSRPSHGITHSLRSRTGMAR